MSKINFAAKHEYEYISNFKILQDVFKRNKIDKVCWTSILAYVCKLTY